MADIFLAEMVVADMVCGRYRRPPTVLSLTLYRNPMKLATWLRLTWLAVVGGVVALSVEYRTCDQEVVGSSLGRARGIKTLGMFLTPMCLCSPSSTSWYQPKVGDTLRLGSKGRYGLCVGGR